MVGVEWMETLSHTAKVEVIVTSLALGKWRFIDGLHGQSDRKLRFVFHTPLSSHGTPPLGGFEKLSVFNCRTRIDGFQQHFPLVRICSHIHNLCSFCHTYASALLSPSIVCPSRIIDSHLDFHPTKHSFRRRLLPPSKGPHC